MLDVKLLVEVFNGVLLGRSSGLSFSRPMNHYNTHIVVLAILNMRLLVTGLVVFVLCLMNFLFLFSQEYNIVGF